MRGGQESKVSTGSTPQSKSRHQNVRENAAHKESSREKSHIREQGLMAGANCQAGWGKTVQPRLWSRRGFYRRGRPRKSAHVWESPAGMEPVPECRNLCQRARLPPWLPTHKMVTLLLYHGAVALSQECKGSCEALTGRGWGMDGAWTGDGWGTDGAWTGSRWRMDRVLTRCCREH
jgi:hypothetical protein